MTAQNGLLINDFNIELGDIFVNPTAITTTQNGELTLNIDGSFTYQPNLDFVGVDSFTYSVSNDQGLTATAQVILSESGVNTFPSANDDQFTLEEDSPTTLLNVLANDTDADGDTITISNVDNTVGEVAIVNEQIEFTPPANFSGEIVLTYTIIDGFAVGTPGATDNTATVTITVTPINDAPIANTDSVTTSADSPIEIDVLANDSDIEGNNLTIVSASVARGSVVITNNKLTYTPVLNSSGVEVISYTITDGVSNASSTVSVTIVTTSSNNPPVANSDSATINEDAPPLLIDVLANDSDPDGDTLTITAVTADSGSVSIVNNKLQYTPLANANGVVSINYTVDDGNGGTNTGSLLITVTPVNDAPVASDQSFNISENATDGDNIGTVSASDIESHNLSYSLVSGNTALFEINSTSGLLTVKGVHPFDFDTTSQYTLSVGVIDDGTPSETTTIDITININDDADPLIPVEDGTFGRPITGDLDLSGVFSSGEFNDSIVLNNNIYFVGLSNNDDKDIVIASYTTSGALNTAFNNDGVKVLDLAKDEEATAIISDGTSLFVAYSSFDGTNTEACLLKMNTAGVLSSDSGDNDSGIRCTTLASTLTINDLEFNDDKIQAVGKAFNGNDDDSLWIKYDRSSLEFEAGSPKIVDVSGANRDDEAFAIKNFDSSELMVVGSVTNLNGDKDILIRYLISDGENSGSFNNGSAFTFDLSNNNKDDELFAVGGAKDINFTALAGGYVTHNSGEKEAVILAIDKTGVLVTSFGNAGAAIYDIDGNGGSGNGGADITGIKYEPIKNEIILSGTTGISATEKLFSARILTADGSLDSTYGVSGVNIVSGISGKQFAKAATIDSNDTVWIAGANDDSNTKPFVTAIDDQAALFTNFADVGYLTFNTISAESDDQSMQVLQLSNGAHAGKYILASTTQSSSIIKLVLTRFTIAGSIDTSFSKTGHKEIAIDLSSSDIALAELNTGSLVITGTKNKTGGEEGFVAKVDQNGDLDTSFATDGIYSTSITGAEKLNLTDLAIDDGNIVAIGSAVMSGTPRAFIMMLESDGSLEDDFGDDGVILGSPFEYYKSIYINDDDIFIGGKSVSGATSEIIALKLDSDGDQLFKYTGETTTDTDNKMVSILADNSNKLYLVTNFVDTPNKASVIRLLASGAIDNSFAVNGVGQYVLASTGDTQIKSAALDSNNNIILTGMSNNKGMLARILANGTIDDTFGQNGSGFYEASQCVSTHAFTSIILQSDTQIVVSSTCSNGVSNNVSISKFNFYIGGVKP